MLELPQFAVEDRDEIASLVREHPWALVASVVDEVPVVSHVPVLLDSVEGEIATVSSHLARRDARSHHLGEVEMVVVVQGPHGYVTPAWYPPGTYVPTWDSVVVHLHGVAESLDADATWDVLARTVEHLEDEPDAVVPSVVAGLEDDEVHASQELAATMRRRLGPNGEPR